MWTSSSSCSCSWLLLLALLPSVLSWSWGCQLPRDWRPQSESCRAELAEIIVFGRVLSLHRDTYSVYNLLPWTHTELLYSAEIELLCDQAWGSMLEMPAGSRFNISGLGYFPCFSYSVTENNSYYFFLRLYVSRMDEDYNLLPHGVNFQDAIFSDVPENHRMFSSLFQFSNCSQDPQEPSLDWDQDSRFLCSSVQRALFEEEERVQNLTQQVRLLEKANGHLRERVKTLKRQLRQAQKDTKDQHNLHLKHQPHPDQDTTAEEKPHPDQDTTAEEKPHPDQRSKS